MIESATPKKNTLKSLSTEETYLLSNNSSISCDEEDGLHSASFNCEKEEGTIGMLGGISIAVNSLTGPAMLSLPATFQRSGLIPTIVTLLLVCFLSGISSSLMANIISLVPGNQDFHQEIEFSDSFRIFLGDTAYTFTQIAYYGCVTCLNIAGIVDIAQVIDCIVSHTFPSTFAIQWTNIVSLDTVQWDQDACTKHEIRSGICIPFHKSTEHFILTIGYILAAFIFLPMSLLDLKDNINCQVFAFVLLILYTLQFVATVTKDGVDFKNVSLWGSEWGDLIGVILFNFVLVLAVPAICHEKKPGVSIQKVIWSSSMIATVLYITIGYLVAISVSHSSENMLNTMISGAFGKATTITSELFAFFIIGFSIPIFSIVARLNLTASGLCSPSMGTFLSVIVPWCVSWMFYNGSSTAKLLGWGGIIFTSIVAFLAPFFLALNVTNNFDMTPLKLFPSLIRRKEHQVLFLYLLLAFSIAFLVFAMGEQIFG